MPSPRRRRAITREKKRRALTHTDTPAANPTVVDALVEEPVVPTPKTKTATNRVGRGRKTRTTE